MNNPQITFYNLKWKLCQITNITEREREKERERERDRKREGGRERETERDRETERQSKVKYKGNKI